MSSTQPELRTNQQKRSNNITTLIGEKDVKNPDLTSDDKHRKGLGIYMLQLIHRKITLPFILMGGNIGEIIQRKLIEDLEGRCIIEGFVKNNSVRIINYSAGIMKSNNVVFDVIVECLICCPVEGMRFKIKVDNITKAGIRGSSGSKSPVDVFVARDHHYKDKYFNNVQVGDTIQIRVLGQRYEINDPKISVIAEMMKPKKLIKRDPSKKIRLVIK
jgi:DNA-directed RNA polymerase subunit E'/Rpb7